MAPFANVFIDIVLAHPVYAYAQDQGDDSEVIAPLRQYIPSVPQVQPRGGSRALQNQPAQPGASATERSGTQRLAQKAKDKKGTDIKNVKIRECKPVRGRFPWNFERRF